MYDKDLIKLAAKNSGFDEEVMHDIDETATNSFLYSLSMGAHHLPLMGGLPDMPITDKAFIACSQVIKNLAEKESCIIVGRCADSILKEHKNLFTVFVHDDFERRVDRICEFEKCTRNEASSMIKKADRKRAAYHNYYADTKWGDVKTYDICVKGKIGIEKAAEIIKYAAEHK